MKRNMVTRSIDWMLILRESAEAPTDAEWDECLHLLAAYRPNFAKVKVLVITEGGGPTQAQRKRLSAVAEGHPLHVAVVSESMKVRFIVSSVALFLREIASFRRHEMHEAYTHLRMDAREMRVAEKAMAEMDKEVASEGRPRPNSRTM